MQLVPDSFEQALKYLNPKDADQANRRRIELLESMEHLKTSFKGSKPHLGALSPGCQRCGDGEWSCLFLHTLCNGSCFFCPGYGDIPNTPPQAERIVFSSPENYAGYLEQFKFRGASFSGGEPFLKVDRMVSFIKAIRERLGDSVYLWAYTNGKPVTLAKLKEVARAGLDEVRFNIVDSEYNLEKIRAAIGVLSRVTVEIPAIPEDQETLRRCLGDMKTIGVDHLNLHQLMIAGSNTLALQSRGYTFLRSEVPSVLESELSALETLRFATDNCPELAINYCSLIYKIRWQNRVEDLRAGSLMMQPGDTLTERGMIRRINTTNTEAGSQHSTVTYYRTVVGEPESTQQYRSIPGYGEQIISPTQTIGVRLIPLCSPLPLSKEDLKNLRRGFPPAFLSCFETIEEGLPDYC